MLREHPLGEVHTLGEIVELLAQRLQLLIHDFDPSVGAASKLAGVLYAPVPERQIIRIPKFPRHEQYHVVQPPNPQATERHEHGDARAILAHVKAMESEEASEEP